MADDLLGVPGSVFGLWRYPVKSMAGEEISAAAVTPRGLLGDRAYALVDRASNRAATVRTWAAALLCYRAQFVTEPTDGASPPPVRITTPQGAAFASTQPNVDKELSRRFGHDLILMSAAPSGLLVQFPAGTLSGKLKDATEVPLAGAAPAGAFFDYACIHMIATSTLNHLQTLYPQGRIDVRRFRPNIIVAADGEPFIENSWAGKTLALGDEVLLRVSIPCPRCVNATLPQGDLPHDPGILRMLAQHNMRDLGDFGKLPCAGVYADVVRTGTIRRADKVQCSD